MQDTKYIVRNKITEHLSKIFAEYKCPYSNVYIWSNPNIDYDMLHCDVLTNYNGNSFKGFSFYYANSQWHYSAKCRDKWNLEICKELNRFYPDCFDGFRQQRVENPIQTKIEYIENSQTKNISQILKNSGYKKCLCHIFEDKLYLNDPSTPDNYGIWYSYSKKDGWIKTCRTMDPWYGKIYNGLCKCFPNGVKDLQEYKHY